MSKSLCVSSLHHCENLARVSFLCAERRSTAQYGGDLVTWCNVTNMSAKKIVKVNIMGEILSRDVTLLTCRQKIIVKVNIMGEILSRDVKLLTCRQKIIVNGRVKKLLYWWNEGLSSSPLQLVLSSTKSSDSLQDITPVRNMPSNHS